MKPRTLLAVVAIWLISTAAFAQPTVFLVRHAERADTAAGGAPAMDKDPSLSAEGHQRAGLLAAVLKDAGITAIYVTEFKRTHETAAPIAKALGVTVTEIYSKDMAGLLARLKPGKGRVLVVGHSNSVPEVIKGLGVKTPVTIGDAEYDNLFIVTPQRDLLRLRF
jgi:broad specificity phosphatase PhoE